MKKLFFLFMVFTLAVFVVKAEEYKPFRVDLGIGYSKPKGEGGLLFSVEPKYSIIPNLAVGIRFEIASLEKKEYGSDYLGSIEEISTIKMNPSFLLTGNYWFTSGKFRPYAGAGAGFYRLVGSSEFFNEDDDDKGRDLNFGAMLSAGIDMFHVRFAVEYNFAGKNKNDQVNYNYLGLKLNIYLGGGLRK